MISDPAGAAPATPPAARRILAVGAHPDDVEFGCGGILIEALTDLALSGRRF